MYENCKSWRDTRYYADEKSSKKLRKLKANVVENISCELDKGTPKFLDRIQTTSLKSINKSSKLQEENKKNEDNAGKHPNRRIIK